MRILVADDDEEILLVAGHAFARDGRAAAEIARGGRAALERALAFPPDAVLTDLRMADLDGLALLRALRDEERTRAVPVILLTGRADDDSRAKALALGAAGVLPKPFDPLRLPEDVFRLLAAPGAAPGRG